MKQFFRIGNTKYIWDDNFSNIIFFQGKGRKISIRINTEKQRKSNQYYKGQKWHSLKTMDQNQNMKMYDAHNKLLIIAWTWNKLRISYFIMLKM